MFGRDKDRAVSPTLSIAFIITVITATAAIKATVPKVFKPELFAGSRFKFKVFCTQIKFGIWADSKRLIEKKLMRYTEDQVLWTVSFLKGDVYIRIKLYIIYRLNTTYLN
jgi:hypothetical protein